MKYQELKEIFKQLKLKTPQNNLTAHIIFHESSYIIPYSLLSRTYCLNSNNKAFYPYMSGYSIHASCLDGTDQGVRLDLYMAEEGNEGGWIVQDCYILEHMRDVAAIPNYERTVQPDNSICYFFGDTCIRVHEKTADTKIQLVPIAGNQVACGEWNELSIDRLYAYCTLLERHLNKGV